MKAILVVLFGAVLLPAKSIQVVELSGFGGSSGVAYRVSDTGVIVGYALTPAYSTHAFSTTGGSGLVDLNGPAASESFAYGVNNAGQVAGASYVNGQAHGSIWSSTGTTDLGAGSSALDVNAAGDVVGGNGQAFLYSNGTMQELGILAGGNWTSAEAINDQGTVAGYGNVAGGAFRGFVWTAASGMTQLGTLGGNNSYAMAINNGGEIVGHAGVASGYEHAFATRGGTLTDLGTLGGGNSYAYGINDAGAIVGYSLLSGNSVMHAFAYFDGQMIDLNSLLAPNSGWVLQQAFGINNLGDIVGVGTFQGQSAAFLLDPPQFALARVPEPGTLGLLWVGLGLLVIGRFRIRRRGNMPH